jgi:hypothetical protein
MESDRHPALPGFRRMKAMAKHRTHSIEFKRQVAQDSIAGEILHGLAKRQNIYPEFSEAIKVEKAAANQRVERSLYERANGYNYEAVKIFMPAGSKHQLLFTTSSIARPMLALHSSG